MLDPIKLTKATEKYVCSKRNNTVLRRYWRFRGGRWYGGIATADCVGCNLRCVFCGPLLTLMRLSDKGELRSPAYVVRRLTDLALVRGYKYIRVSGGEPTICFDHLLEVLKIATKYPFIFILETNGILIGEYDWMAEEIARFSNVHVRVSIKGTNPDEFERLTLANKSYFKNQLNALKNLLDHDVSFHPAIVASFSEPEDIDELINEISDIAPELRERIEIEYIILYKHVINSLKKHKVIPKKAYNTSWELLNEEEIKKFILRNEI